MIETPDADWQTTFVVSGTREQVVGIIENYRFIRYRIDKIVLHEASDEEGANAELVDYFPGDGSIRIIFFPIGPAEINLQILAYTHKSRTSPNRPHAIQYGQELEASLKQHMAWEPLKPPPEASLPVWFDYRRQIVALGKHFTLKEIAIIKSLNYDYVRHQHTLYKATLS